LGLTRSVLRARSRAGEARRSGPLTATAGGGQNHSGEAARRAGHSKGLFGSIRGVGGNILFFCTGVAFRAEFHRRSRPGRALGCEMGNRGMGTWPGIPLQARRRAAGKWARSEPAFAKRPYPSQSPARISSAGAFRCSRDLTASELPCHKILRPRGSRDAQSREVCKAKCIRERAVEC